MTHLNCQWFSLVGPFEWFCHGFVEVLNEGLDFGLQVLAGRKITPTNDLSDQNRKPDFDLIEPGCVLWGKVKGNAMAFVAQELLTREPRLEDALFAFLAKLNVDVTVPCDQSDQAFG